jgi:hypothetical protein
MRFMLTVATVIVAISFPVGAQQGPALPAPGSDRGPAFPKSVSPTQSNPTNWVKPPSEPDPSSYDINPRATYWYNRTRRWR